MILSRNFQVFFILTISFCLPNIVIILPYKLRFYDFIEKFQAVRIVGPVRKAALVARGLSVFQNLVNLYLLRYSSFILFRVALRGVPECRWQRADCRTTWMRKRSRTRNWSDSLITCAPDCRKVTERSLLNYSLSFLL